MTAVTQFKKLLKCCVPEHSALFCTVWEPEQEYLLSGRSQHSYTPLYDAYSHVVASSCGVLGSFNFQSKYETLHKCAVALVHRDIVDEEPSRQREGPSQLLLLSFQNLIILPQWLKKNPFFSNEHQRPSPSLRCAAAALFTIKTEQLLRGDYGLCERLQWLPLQVERGKTVKNSREAGG